MLKTLACLTVMTFLVPSQYAVADQPALFAADAERLSAAILDPSAAHHGIRDGKLLNLALRALASTGEVPGLPLSDDELATINVRQGDGPAFRLAAADALAVDWPYCLRACPELGELCEKFDVVSKDSRATSAERATALMGIVRRLREQAHSLPVSAPSDRVAKVRAEDLLQRLEFDVRRLADCGSATVGETCEFAGSGEELFGHIAQHGLEFAPAGGAGRGVYRKLFEHLTRLCQVRWRSEFVLLAATRKQERQAQRDAELKRRREKIETAAAQAAVHRRSRLAARRERDTYHDFYGDTSCQQQFSGLMPRGCDTNGGWYRSYWTRTYRTYSSTPVTTYRWVTY